MVESNGCLSNAEPVPAVTDGGGAVLESSLLKNGYAFRPGLYALIQLAEEAANTVGDSPKLTKTIIAAKQAYKADQLPDTAYFTAIRELRHAIRSETATSESRHPNINRFPTEPLF